MLDRLIGARIGSRWWPAVALLMLLPLWCVGMFGRLYWTPDEPREADIAWHMQSQPSRALPQLGGKPFMEKPPLTYWVTAGAMHLLGDSPAASRLPNLLYAALATLALGALAASMAGRAAALTAALIGASALLCWRVSIWLAPDAALVSGCAIGLLGAYRGYSAPAGRQKLLWYLLMHLGAAMGFMAKSAPGWIVPALALLGLIVWERQWRELLRWELYAGLLLQGLLVGSWVRAVWLGPDGDTAMRVLFWNNLMGRFTQVNAPAQFDYSRGHQNWPGKYWVQLPSYLYPWSLLALAALARAWRQLTRKQPQVSVQRLRAWRFAVVMTIPFLLLLSVASTARDVYAAPVMGGFALLIALWLEESADSAILLDRWAWQGTTLLVGLFALLCSLALLLLAAGHAYVSWPQALLSVGAMVTALWWLSRRAARERRHRRHHESILWTYTAFAIALVIAAQLLFPAIDRVQNLPLLAAEVRANVGAGRLALLDPDETTIAMMNFRRPEPYEVIEGDASGKTSAARQWFGTHGAGDRILMQLPGRAAGPLTPLLDRFARQRTPDDGIVREMRAAGAATLLMRLELPHGRRYALLGPPVTVLAAKIRAQ